MTKVISNETAYRLLFVILYQFWIPTLDPYTPYLCILLIVCGSFALCLQHVTPTHGPDTCIINVCDLQAGQVKSIVCISSLSFICSFLHLLIHSFTH